MFDPALSVAGVRRGVLSALGKNGGPGGGETSGKGAEGGDGASPDPPEAPYKIGTGGNGGHGGGGKSRVGRNCKKNIRTGPARRRAPGRGWFSQRRG